MELLGRSEALSWDVYLDSSSLQLAAESYCHSCDVTCALSERTSPSAAVLRLAATQRTSVFYRDL